MGDRQLYVGTEDGVLLEYSLPEPNAAGSGGGGGNLVNAKELGPVSSILSVFFSGFFRRSRRLTRRNSELDENFG